MTVSKYKNNIGNATQLQVLRPLVLESQKNLFLQLYGCGPWISAA
jgi:hypothetical protein